MMQQSVEIEAQPPCDIQAPAAHTAPLVFASPHSGRNYPKSFIAASALDARAIRRSEDGFVDELFAAAPAHGAPLLRALFPRAFVDANREPYELDPAMFEDALPAFVNTRSSRVAAGLGTVARVVSSGCEIYRGKLRFAEAAARIEQFYRPYHEALRGLIEATEARFGCAVLIDCHSMPSVGGPMDPDAGRGRADFVLGDCFGNACAERVADCAERTLRGLGYRVLRNRPFAGGFVTRHYGNPRAGRHALQVEINRALYMDEERIVPTAGFVPLARDLARLIEALCALDPATLR